MWQELSQVLVTNIPAEKTEQVITNVMTITKGETQSAI